MRTLTTCTAGLLLALLGSLFMTPMSGGSSTRTHSSIRVLVFDCVMSIPGGFVLNSREKKHLAFFRESSLLDRTRIVISDYSDQIGEALETIEAREVDGLTIERLRFRESTGSDATDQVVRIHDGAQSIEIYSPEASVVDALVESCLETKGREQAPRRGVRPPVEVQ